MKNFLCLVFFLCSSYGFSQTSAFQVWTETGIKIGVSKRVSLGADWTNRIGERGFVTMFPQASIKVKVFDWFRPSIDFRYIIDKSSSGVYSGSSRINLNAQFNYDKKRFIAGLRFRYQYGFDRLSANYDSDFDK